MDSACFILLEIDHKPPLREPATAAAASPEVLEQDEATEAPRPLWPRVLGYIICYGIELLWEIISTPG